MSLKINSELGVVTGGTQGQNTNNTPAQNAQGALFNYGEEVSTTQKTSSNQPPKLDFTNFKKGERAHANEVAREAMNEVKDTARTFNNDFPTRQYIIDYSTFPKPEDFDPKNLGGKDQAYNEWKAAVKEWKEDCKQDMEAMRHQNFSDVNRNISAGFLGVYQRLGLTEAFINHVCQELKGDVNAIKERLDAAVEELKQDGAKTRQTVQADGASTRERMNTHAEKLHNHIYDSGEFTRHVVEREGNRTRTNNEIEHEITRDAINTQADTTQNVVREEGEATRKAAHEDELTTRRILQKK